MVHSQRTRVGGGGGCREAIAQSRPLVCVLHKQSLVEAAGIEPVAKENTNLMVSRDFGC
jgi:hypothetical protein